MPSSAQLVKIGLYEDINRLYVQANQNFVVLEDRSAKPGTFDSQIALVYRKANEKVLLRSSPEAANNLVVAAAPDLATTSNFVKFTCMDKKTTRITKFDSRKPEEIEYATDKSEKPCLFKLKKSVYDSGPYNVFRGSIVVVPSEKNFLVINELELEDYLRGVVASEMPSSWHSEALKAQAVAARTYTMKNLGRRGPLYDLKATVEDQVYLGYNNEKSSSNNAIDKTKSSLMIDKQGLLVDAFYSSHSGGMTALPETVWQISPKHYLQNRFDNRAGTRPWQRTFSQADLSSKFKDLGLRTVVAVTILERTLDGRVASVLVSGLDKATLLQHRYLRGEEFRHRLKLDSTKFELFNRAKENASGEGLQFQNLAMKIPFGKDLVIKGSGYGHGIGMSQHGAKALAQQGLDFKKILGFYYPGAKLTRLP